MYKSLSALEWMRRIGAVQTAGQDEDSNMISENCRRGNAFKTYPVLLSTFPRPIFMLGKKQTFQTVWVLLIALGGAFSFFLLITSSARKSQLSATPAEAAKSLFVDEGLNSYQPDSSWGGLLVRPEDYGSASCQSRGHPFHKHAKYEPSSNLMDRLRKYEDLHRKCTGEGMAYRDVFGKEVGISEADSDCQYVVWISFSGLGNRIISLVSAFLYALVTNRVLLIDRSTDMSEIFCEPFPGASWLLPADFPPGWLEAMNGSSPYRFGHEEDKDNLSHSKISYLHYGHISDDTDKTFFCELPQQQLKSIPWLFVRANNYFVPAMMFVPVLRDEIDKLFPQREAIFHLLVHYLLNPSDDVWAFIMRFYRAYLANSALQVGLQIRTFTDLHLQHLSDQIEACILQNNILPNISQHAMEELSRVETEDTGKPISLLVASLQQSYYQELRERYLKFPTVNGKHVGVHQPSFEKNQKTDISDHNKRALADIYLLSFSDVLVTSAWSTFGYAAQGLAGIKPYFLLKAKDNPDPALPDPVCTQALSPEPCQHEVHVWSCPADAPHIDHEQLLPYVKYCEDIPWGTKIIERS